MRFGFSYRPFFVIFSSEFLLWYVVGALSMVVGVILFPFVMVHTAYILHPKGTYFGIAWLTVVIALGCFLKIGTRLELQTASSGRFNMGVILLAGLYLFSYGGIVCLKQPGDTPGTWPPAQYRVAHALPRTSPTESLKHF